MTSLATGDGPTARQAASLPGRPPVFLMINNFEMGGTERQFVALAKALDSHAFDLHLGCVRRRGPLLGDLGEVPEFPLGGSLYGFGSMRARLALRGHLRRIQIAVAHAFDFYTNLTLAPAARMARVPVIIGSHRQLGDLLTPAQFRAQAMAFRWCDAVVCNSQAAAGRLVEHGFSKSKLTVIGNGLLLESFPQPQPPNGQEPLRVGMIARMNARYKNHSLFLRAAAQVAKKFPTVRFVLVGDGPLRHEIERQAFELGITEKVDFIGERQDIPQILSTMSVSVVPSASESLSNVILESMAAGVPTVASDVGGNRELLDEHRGVLIPPANGEALAQAITSLLENATQRATFADNARRYAHSEYSIGAIRGKYAELYCELLAKKNWQPSVARTFGTDRSQRRLRVLIVAPTLRWVGGQSIQADLLLRNWSGDREVEAKFLPVDPQLPAPLAWIERIPALRTAFREPIYFAHLWRGLREADVAHIFSASYSSFLLAPAPAWLVARLRGKKTLINYRSGEARDHLQRSRIARYILRKTDRRIVPSGYLIDVFREFGLSAQAVPNIVDLSQFHFRVRDPLRPHLVCTRGFHPYYCVDVVVRAFAEVQHEFPDAQLDLVGKGSEEAAIRQLVADLKLRNVQFTGVASRQEIGRCYDKADIFINASYLDNMPVSVLEAFASGTPVVTTSPESMKYLVNHERTGLLSEPGDVEALAGNVIRLLRNPELARGLAANAYKESEHYRWEAVRAQWLQVYRSMSRPAPVLSEDPALRQHDVRE